MVESTFAVSPLSLYGEDFDDFSRFLQMRPDHLVKEHGIAFCSLIFKHICKVHCNPVIIRPPVDDDILWLNTSRPLDFEVDLRNKICVIDFFTYCCINCIHILPYLKEVEADYQNNPSFSVIGVHTPKFSNEKNIERVKDALILNDINHPVINDFKCLFWKKYGVTCWPTVFIIGPQNMLLFILVGEAQIDKLPFMCKSVMNYYESHGERLDMEQVPLMPLNRPVDKELLFPSNVSSNSEFIVVSDTGHNRILLMSSKLDIQMKIGSSSAGCEDGSFREASFKAPHGTAWMNNTIFVADTGNHSIRKIDFCNQRVSTVFKMTNEVLDAENPENVTYGENTHISTQQNVFHSPWDVCIGPKLGSDLTKLNVLYIAVAGSHQIWSLCLETNSCVPFAGSGKEENRQNLYRLRAGFAQPSGITYSKIIPEFLFVADSESSTIKSISLVDGSVKVVVGGALDPMDLFGFGDVDGKGRDAKLQHPMSVCIINNNLLAVADTYNHKIKLVKLEEKSCSTLAAEYLHDLCEPSGICTIDEKLIIADTNNHRIQSLSIPKLISPLLFPPSIIEVVSLNTSPDIKPVTKVKLRCGGEICCFFFMDVHPRYSLASADAPWEVSFEGNSKCTVRYTSAQLFSTNNNPAGTPPILIKADQYSLAKGYSENSQCVITFKINAQLCDAIDKVCHLKDLTFKVEIEYAELGAKSVKLNFRACIFDLY